MSYECFVYVPKDLTFAHNTYTNVEWIDIHEGHLRIFTGDGFMISIWAPDSWGRAELTKEYTDVIPDASRKEQS